MCNLLPTSSFPLSFPPKLGGKNFVGLEGKFSTPFSFSLVFSPEPNKGKFHFSPYFPLLLFHPPCFHPNQTGPKALMLLQVIWPLFLGILLDWQETCLEFVVKILYCIWKIVAFCCRLVSVWQSGGDQTLKRWCILTALPTSQNPRYSHYLFQNNGHVFLIKVVLSWTYI